MTIVGGGQTSDDEKEVVPECSLIAFDDPVFRAIRLQATAATRRVRHTERERVHFICSQVVP